jgi:hypothetical protein
MHDFSRDLLLSSRLAINVAFYKNDLIF